ncbi:MAG TPA: precorrin-2 methylase [Archaeoglobus profundus]|nr:precorrin-2 methylase [Archaeoglobus profundus]
MLYGVGLGLNKDLLTLKAVELIKKVDEIIVPGKMAYEIVKDVREPTIVEFPMGKGKIVAQKLAQELAQRDDDVAFCCIGDPTFYSTFQHLVNELLKIKSDAKFEIIPGVSSISCALAKSKTFISNSAYITTQDFNKIDVAVVLKVKNPKIVEQKLRGMGFSKFILLENMFMNEKIYYEMPESSSYFSVMIAKK